MVCCTRRQIRSELDMERENNNSKPSDKIKIGKLDVVLVEGGKQSMYAVVVHRGNELLLELIKRQRKAFRRLQKNHKDLITLCECVVDGLARKPTSSRFLLLPFKEGCLRLMTRDESVSAVMKAFLTEGKHVEQCLKLRVERQHALPRDCVGISLVNRSSKKEEFSKGSKYRTQSEESFEEISWSMTLNPESFDEQSLNIDLDSTEDWEKVLESFFTDDKDIE